MNRLPIAIAVGLLALMLACNSGGGGSSNSGGSTAGGVAAPLPNLTNVVFFRDNAAPGGDGSLAAPFNSLVAALTAGAGKTVFVFAGSGNPIPFAGAFPANTTVIGEG
ncbi:MAG: hypothetical protein KC910_17175, partial [Candidatus Eremiobacteraeota bacterium]|nr:hypothetical protein [Candidatus Eremiobacteraeota bacterium]